MICSKSLAFHKKEVLLMVTFWLFAGRGCDESKVHQIAYGTSKKLMKGAVYQFRCDEAAVLVGSSVVFCDGRKWNDSAPTCLCKSYFYFLIKTTIIYCLKKGAPGEPALKLRVDNEPLTLGGSADVAVLRAGHSVELRCTAKGGNPIPSLTFTKNGSSFGPGPKTFHSSHTFVATPHDNGAILGCIAQNAADRRAQSKTVTLNVLCKLISMFFHAFYVHALMVNGLKNDIN